MHIVFIDLDKLLEDRHTDRKPQIDPAAFEAILAGHESREMQIVLLTKKATGNIFIEDVITAFTGDDHRIPIAVLAQDEYCVPGTYVSNAYSDQNFFETRANTLAKELREETFDGNNLKFWFITDEPQKAVRFAGLEYRQFSELLREARLTRPTPSDSTIQSAAATPSSVEVQIKAATPVQTIAQLRANLRRTASAASSTPQQPQETQKPEDPTTMTFAQRRALFQR